ncbi:hypothetical protein RJ641_029063, partial [Dillenia turbinata]
VLSIKIREEKVGIHMKENHEEWLDLLKSNQIDPKGKVELELELEMELGLWLERELELGLELEYQSSRSEVESHEWESDIPRHLQRHWGSRNHQYYQQEHWRTDVGNVAVHHHQHSDWRLRSHPPLSVSPTA